MNSTGGLAPLLHLERKADFHASIWDEIWLAYWNSKIPVANGEEPWVSCLNSGWGPSPPQWLKRNLEVPFETWKVAWLPWANMRHFLRSPLQFERNPKIPSATHETPQNSPFNARWGLPPKQWFKSNPALLFTTQKENWLAWHKRLPVST